MQAEAIARAVDEDAFRLSLSPLIGLADGALCAFTAVPVLDGDSGVAELQRAAADAGALSAMTLRLLARLLRLRAALREAGFEGELALDVPLVLLADADFLGAVVALLEGDADGGTGLCLEITETADAIDLAPVQAQLARLKLLGLRFALDNIGSPRANLDRSALDIFDCIKIDRALINEMVSSRIAIAGLAAILVFARGLGWRVVAEGVDDLGIAERLALLGVAAAQGEVWPERLTEDEVVDWWRQHQADGASFPVAQLSTQAQPPLLDDDDRARMAALGFPVWVFDADNLRLLESNAAGLRFWGAASNAELAAFDLQDIGPAAINRVRSYRNRFRSRARIAEPWVFYPAGERHEVFCIMEPRRDAEGHLLLLVEMHEGLSGVAGDDLGGEFVRDTSVALMRLADDGGILWRNPAAEVQFGATARRLQQLAVSPEEVDALLEMALALFDDVAPIRLRTLAGERAFLCSARAVPVSGSGERSYQLLLSMQPMPQG